MTPAARAQAAIEILDTILAGSPAEQALTRWARGSRFAGAKDRAAIRDIVFDALRAKRSQAHLGGAMNGRGLVLGGMRAQGADPTALFTGIAHAPAPLSPEELAHQPGPMPRGVALDCPDWLLPAFDASLGAYAEPVLRALKSRAPVFLRVNLARTDRLHAMAALAEEGIETRPHPLATTALEVTANARAVQRSRAYAAGLVELQDAASQAVIDALPDLEGLKVLDYCAGGGGKALAMAARGAQVSAHDADPARMRDLPARAARAGVDISQVTAPKGDFDLVLCDAPCTGAGSWRRAPAAKWALTPARLAALETLQTEILSQAARLVQPGGWLAYATCSVLESENNAQIARFLDQRPHVTRLESRTWTPLEGGDGFFLALMRIDLE